MTQEKKPNYKELAAEYESLLDMKDEVIQDYSEDIKRLQDDNKFLNNLVLDDEDELRDLRKEIIYVKFDRIALVIVTFLTLIFLILK
jgi:hypothetical protein